MWIIRPKFWNRPEAGAVCSCCGRRVPAAKGARKIVRPVKVDPLLDTRTRGEVLLAGESPEVRDRAERKAAKQGAAWRTIRVRLADGFECITGSYIADGAAAQAQAVRFARARAMESEFERRYAEYVAKCKADAAAAGKPFSFKAPEFDHGYRWAKVPGAGYSESIRACEVAAVASAAVVDGWADASERVRQAVATFLDVEPNRAGLYLPETEERKAA